MTFAKAKKVSTADKDRIHFRLSPDIKARVARAAAITGQGLTDFAVSALSERANEILEQHDTMTLDAEDYSFFLKSLDRSRKPARSTGSCETSPCWLNPSPEVTPGSVSTVEMRKSHAFYRSRLSRTRSGTSAARWFWSTSKSSPPASLDITLC